MEYAKEISAKFHETSAKEDQGIQELFIDVAQTLYANEADQIEKGKIPQRPREYSVLEKPSQKKGGCCK